MLLLKKKWNYNCSYEGTYKPCIRVLVYMWRWKNKMKKGVAGCGVRKYYIITCRGQQNLYGREVLGSLCSYSQKLKELKALYIECNQAHKGKLFSCSFLFHFLFIFSFPFYFHLRPWSILFSHLNQFYVLFIEFHISMSGLSS